MVIYWIFYELNFVGNDYNLFMGAHMSVCVANNNKKHNFEPRFTERQKNQNLKIDDHTFMSDEGVRRITLYDEYIYDICVWCGEKIRKET